MCGSKNLEPRTLNFESSLLTLLPPSPDGKSGWPWTTESDSISDRKPDGTEWPKISIITPSYNQGEFIEETIRSVLLQNYPNLEYIIIDGGSSDNTINVIKKYEKWITFWVSETDFGQSEAINKGFNRATGELVNWICSDDLLCINSLNRFIANYYSENNRLYIGKCLLADREGKIIGATTSSISNFEELVDIKGRWRKNDSIAQQATLYPLRKIREIEGVRTDNHYSMDYELWGDLLLKGTQITNIPLEIGIFRWYEGQKTADVKKATRDLIRSARHLIDKNGDKSKIVKTKLKLSLTGYYYLFLYHEFRSFIGLKRRFKKLFGSGVQNL